MTRLATAVAFGILALLAAGHPVHASSCGLAPGDADARAAVRSLVAQQCDCASATDRHVYKRCVSVVVKNAVGSGMLPTHCAADVMR